MQTSIMMPEYSENGNGQVGSEQIQAALNDLQTSVKLTDFGMSTRMDTKCRCAQSYLYCQPRCSWFVIQHVLQYVLICLQKKT